MVQQVAIDKEEWERRDRGEKPRPKPKKVMPEHKPPIDVDRTIEFDDIDVSKVAGFTEVLKTQKNEDGVKFIGFDVTIKFKDGKSVSGWMAEGDVIKLRQFTRFVR